MALPFFRKDRSKPEPEQPRSTAKSGAAETSLSPGLTQFGAGAPVHQGIVVEEVGGDGDAALSEAAILYASGLVSQKPELKLTSYPWEILADSSLT